MQVTVSSYREGSGYRSTSAAGMGCRMTVSQDVPDEYIEIPNLLSLPDEMLVKIMSFLPDTRDRIKLRCVTEIATHQ